MEIAELVDLVFDSPIRPFDWVIRRPNCKTGHRHSIYRLTAGQQQCPLGLPLYQSLPLGKGLQLMPFFGSFGRDKPGRCLVRHRSGAGGKDPLSGPPPPPLSPFRSKTIPSEQPTRKHAMPAPEASDRAGHAPGRGGRKRVRRGEEGSASSGRLPAGRPSAAAGEGIHPVGVEAAAHGHMPCWYRARGAPRSGGAASTAACGADRRANQADRASVGRTRIWTMIVDRTEIKADEATTSLYSAGHYIWAVLGPIGRVPLPLARYGYSKLRTPSLLVHSHRLRPPRRATVVRLGARDAERLYRSRFVHVEFFPADIGAVLGTFLAVVDRGGYEWRGIDHFLSSPPASWAVASAWDYGSVFRLECVYGLGGDDRDAALAAEAQFASIVNMARGTATAVAVEVAALDLLRSRIPH
ncbi:hypothetical protein C2845_PM08G27480 [Panicum miliaceum]|uniref:Uncharacterized protein n=1 Tax=Panicum miliaceum TaxID=4540 RepID=A0A3L6R383_PANMI|nr:hypothetical protein C2845_PM08G27480 [Panicum miliaceum]